MSTTKKKRSRSKTKGPNSLLQLSWSFFYKLKISTLQYVIETCLEMSQIIVLFDGYSNSSVDNTMVSNCSCTLLKGTHNIIVDTMTAWDSKKILDALEKNEMQPDKINFVISTHGHSDHIGNNNLFLNAKHIVGFDMSFKDTYYPQTFSEGGEFVIDLSVKVIPTPGHTLSDVSVIARSNDMETIAISGDLFEKFEDIEDPSIWLDAGSQSPELQKANRSKVADFSDWIVPGHGPKFKVTDVIRKSLKAQMEKK